MWLVMTIVCALTTEITANSECTLPPPTRVVIVWDLSVSSKGQSFETSKQFIERFVAEVADMKDKVVVSAEPFAAPALELVTVKGLLSFPVIAAVGKDNILQVVNEMVDDDLHEVTSIGRALFMLDSLMGAPVMSSFIQVRYQRMDICICMTVKIRYTCTFVFAQCHACQLKGDGNCLLLCVISCAFSNRDNLIHQAWLRSSLRV
jgi:hypothetical protein